LPARSLRARHAAYGAVAATLASLSDEELDCRLGAARVLGAGIGGQTAVLDVDGTDVFVKRIPLTDQERRLRSTANVFELPTVCHYGIGGPGFGAWRELDAYATTTDWVLRGDSPSFPLMYHWRVLPRDSPSLPDDLADIERVVEYWQGSPQVRRRVTRSITPRQVSSSSSSTFPRT
jgi:hypothetical protein